MSAISTGNCLPIVELKYAGGGSSVAEFHESVSQRHERNPVSDELDADYLRARQLMERSTESEREVVGEDTYIASLGSEQ